MKNPLLNIAVQAARAAGNIIIRAADRLDTIHITEKGPHDFVTDVDQRAEKEIIAHIQKAYPQHGILGEESGEIGSDEGYQWIIDPLDGTRNFIHGFPQFAVSIAIANKGKIEHGVIYDPTRQELFVASRGKGAFLNDRRMRVSQRSQIEEALLGTGFSSKHNADVRQAHIKTLESLLNLNGDVRRAGAAALDLAYVAAGRLDGFWEIGLHSWDIAAGALMIKEAGGMVCDIDGSEEYLKSGNVVAGNLKIIKPLLQTIRSHVKDATPL